jgi:hypothetical protein
MPLVAEAQLCMRIVPPHAASPHRGRRRLLADDGAQRLVRRVLHRNKPTGCQWALGLLTGRGGLLMLTEAGLRNSLPTWPSKEAA